MGCPAWRSNRRIASRSAVTSIAMNGTPVRERNSSASRQAGQVGVMNSATSGRDIWWLSSYGVCPAPELARVAEPARWPTQVSRGSRGLGRRSRLVTERKTKICSGRAARLWVDHVPPLGYGLPPLGWHTERNSSQHTIHDISQRARRRTTSEDTPRRPPTASLLSTPARAAGRAGCRATSRPGRTTPPASARRDCCPLPRS
jgi:hypothetical protein